MRRRGEEKHEAGAGKVRRGAIMGESCKSAVFLTVYAVKRRISCSVASIREIKGGLRNIWAK
ncbi:hypothetical protein PMJ22TS4_01770 [Paenibacillus melissococcoides]